MNSDIQRFHRDVVPMADQILSRALSLARTRQDAEDLTQEVLLRAYVGFDSFREGTSLRAWLYRILHNTWISQYRKSRCRPEEVSADCVSELQLTALHAHVSPSAEECALEAITDDNLLAALAGLHDGVRTALYYADVLHFTCKEIADITDCPIGTVSSRLHRGRKQLRASLSRVSADAA
ncbi:sigma-70 family RNA polymerase sigma factor [Mycobacterium sp. NPDC048908]|uniref:sigma-70 family RNA polymerase sigma factor n=1 Tax=Mycobacterium sp. NPDC048908 TaxID=3364292 RepID=UPI003713F1A1